jgi:hypothetical protein
MLWLAFHLEMPRPALSPLQFANCLFDLPETESISLMMAGVCLPHSRWSPFLLCRGSHKKGLIRYVDLSVCRRATSHFFNFRCCLVTTDCSKVIFGLAIDQLLASVACPRSLSMRAFPSSTCVALKALPELLDADGGNDLRQNTALFRTYKTRILGSKTYLL